jgi:hypothetical protein
MCRHFKGAGREEARKNEKIRVIAEDSTKIRFNLRKR